jgi:phosphatidylserine decarboxylase
MVTTPPVAGGAPTLSARLHVYLQYLLPQHYLSRLVWRITRSRRVGLKNFLIERFVKHYRPPMDEAAEPVPSRYATFNEFFTRALKAGARPIDSDPASIVSPVDGTVSAIGRIEGNTLYQAKDRTFSLAALLAGPAAENARFVDGSFATIYLAPFNYHRIHMPCDGALTRARYVPGRLFSVNLATAALIDRLFARNERVVCVFDEGAPPFALVLVGALFVGSMSTRWHGEVSPGGAGARELRVSTGAARQLAKGEEFARFNMGSTVILLLPPGSAMWLADLSVGSRVQVGQRLARRAPAP